MTSVATEANPREITLKAIIVGVILAILLCASTAYVGLKVGRTIAGSIPAAVLSMLILSWFRRTNILEHNIVQTAASAGEVVSAGVIFVIPALVMTGYWTKFSYLEVTAIAIIGGFLGIAFSIPLRRIMIIEKQLPYPEGIAVAEVLKTTDAKKSGRMLLVGGAVSAIFTIMQEMFHIFASEIQAWFRVGPSALGFGLEFSPVLLSAGYIVGLGIGIPIFLGGALTWLIGIPLYGFIWGLPEVASGAILDSVLQVWKEYFRYIGVGTMLVGGLWGVYALRSSIFTIFKTALQKVKPHEITASERRNTDMPMLVVLGLTIFLSIPMYILFNHVFKLAHFPFSPFISILLPISCIVLSILFGFTAAAIAAYMTGIVGSTSLPTSGITISALLIFSLMLLTFLKIDINFSAHKEFALAAGGATIIFGTIVCLAASLSGDNMQDLKAGYLVGATPWKQQFMLMVGVVSAALVIAPILQILYQAYGFGDALPNVNMDPANALAAPQATLMATVTKSIFAGNVQWGMLGIGVVIGILVIILDNFMQKNYQVQVPVLSVALGIYLPLTYVLPLVLGGLVSFIAHKKYSKNLKENDAPIDRLFAAGLIAGNALVGILIAIPLAEGFDFNKISPQLPHSLPIIFGLIAFGSIIAILYKIGISTKK